MVLQVELVSPERILYSGRADMVIARTVGGGDIAFLSGHAPFVGALDIATLTIRTSGEDDKVVAVHGGFVEVSSAAGSSSSPSSSDEDSSADTTVTILSDVAEMSDQIDVDRARRAEEQAQARLQQDDDGEAQAALRRARVRLTTAGTPVS